MNHNGVISLPVKLSKVEAGDIVAMHADGVNTPGGGGADVLGVVLHDVTIADTDQPAAVQLFSAGGSALIAVSEKVSAVATAIYAKNAVKATTTSTANKLIGYSLEAPDVAGNVVRVVLV